jgi:hypothetical protein
MLEILPMPLNAVAADQQDFVPSGKREQGNLFSVSQFLGYILYLIDLG